MTTTTSSSSFADLDFNENWITSTNAFLSKIEIANDILSQKNCLTLLAMLTWKRLQISFNTTGNFQLMSQTHDVMGRTRHYIAKTYGGKFLAMITNIIKEQIDKHFNDVSFECIKFENNEVIFQTKRLCCDSSDDDTQNEIEDDITSSQELLLNLRIQDNIDTETSAQATPQAEPEPESESEQRVEALLSQDDTITSSELPDDDDEYTPSDKDDDDTTVSTIQDNQPIRRSARLATKANKA